MDYVASLRSLIVESKNLGCNAQILAYFVISIVLRKTRLASVGYVCLYLAYVWQIRRSGRRYLACIWQTHVVKTSKIYPRSGCFRRRRAIYKRDVSVRKAKSAIHNADRPVEMGILREVISRDCTLRPTAEGWRVAWQLIRVLAAARGTSRMVP